jgi:hypothetical protein
MSNCSHYPLGSGLPEGVHICIFKKSQFGIFLMASEWKTWVLVIILYYYKYLVYFEVIWYTLRSFSISSHFGIFCQENVATLIIRIRKKKIGFFTNVQPPLSNYPDGF